MFPTPKRYWDLAVVQELLASALQRFDLAGNVEEQIELFESAISIYTELETSHPTVEKYQTACVYPYHHLFFSYCVNDKYDKAKSIVSSFLDLMPRISRDYQRYRSLLDTPVQQFLLLEDISHETIDEQLFEKCRLYLKDMDSLTDDYDFVEAKYKFKAYEAKRISKARGIQEAEQLYLEVINAARILAEKHQTETAWQLVADCYGALYDGYKKVRKGAQASGYIQKALEELDYAIEHSATTVELRETQCQMYGLLANDFKDKSDMESVSAAADLYILQINRYLNLRQETGDDSYVKKIQNVYSKLQGFLSVQEICIKLAQKSGNVPNETIRSYINIIIHVYSSVSDLPESQEKLDYYRELLNDFGNE